MKSELYYEIDSYLMRFFFKSKLNAYRQLLLDLAINPFKIREIRECRSVALFESLQPKVGEIQIFFDDARIEKIFQNSEIENELFQTVEESILKEFTKRQAKNSANDTHDAQILKLKKDLLIKVDIGTFIDPRNKSVYITVTGTNPFSDLIKQLSSLEADAEEKQLTSSV